MARQKQNRLLPAAVLAGFVGIMATPLLAQGPPDGKGEDSKTLGAHWQTRTEARALRLLIPAPRGQIVDTDGFALVQNRVVYRLGLNLPHLAGAEDADILGLARRRLALANQLAGQSWTLEDKAIIDHYQHRRWLPLLFSNTLQEEEITAIQDAGDQAEGLILHPVYERYYPHGAFAPHVLGAIKKEIPIPTGPIGELDPIFEITKGRHGLEDTYDKELTGAHGEINVLFDTDGTELSREIIRPPTPGATVVTTLNLDYQRYTEESLAKNTHGGAMVVIDVRSGDILSMASYPSYDPNIWVGGISQSLWHELSNDPKKPLYAKTYQGVYPPASTFKPIVALAALEDRRIDFQTLFPCPTSLTIGDRDFHNWNKEEEGMLSVVGALKRSCNTWFYAVALETGSDSILSMARNLGFGQTTGIPLAGEKPGLLPNNEEHRQRVGFGIRGGDLANIAIGQGPVLTSPLQVARAMAAIGTGEYLTSLRLVKQLQDIDQNILQSFPPPAKTWLQIHPENLHIVRMGMAAVVSGARGTGARAAIPQAQVAGKTGTAEWNPTKNQNLAWFAGFVPALNPRYAFAAVYEGDPGEKVGGGSKAAPIVHDVLERIYQQMEAEGVDIYEELAENAPKMEIIDFSVAQPAEVIPAQPVGPTREPGIFGRIFRR